MKRLIIVSSVLLTVAGATSYVLAQPSQPVDAGEKPPIVVTVENHEKRLGDVESRTDDIETRTNQNTSDINGLRNSVSNIAAKADQPQVVEKVTTIVEKPAPLEPGDYPITPNDPAPTPPDPHMIVSFVDEPSAHNHSCTYTLQNGQTKRVSQGNDTACYTVGTILPGWLWPR